MGACGSAPAERAQPGLAAQVKEANAAGAKEPAGAVAQAASYRLSYFDIRGLAETSRFLFAVARVPYEDRRYPFSFGVPGDFSTIKRPEFDAAKAAGELDASGGKVPLLEVDGQGFGQSKAIERFLASEFGLVGSGPVEAAQIDCVGEQVRDVKDAYQKVRGIQDKEEKKAGMEKWFAEELPAKMSLLEKMLPASAGPWLVGSKVSYADIVVYQFLAAPGCFFDDAAGAAASFQACPRIKAAIEATAEIKELKEYIAARKETPF